MTFDGGYPGYCALLTSTKADCWGDGTFGVLGDGSAANSSVPVAVAGVLGTGTLKAIANFSVGGSSYCAVTTTGQAHCWGLGGNGALGDGNTSSSSIPTTVIG
jgi:alpha-tubulin suppressor-like RCC1 family protein